MAYARSRPHVWPLMKREHSSDGTGLITKGLHTLDAEIFQAVADTPSPVLDRAMPALSRAADHAKLWLVIAAVMAGWGDRSTRHAAGRGVASQAVSSLITNQVAKRVWRRPRPAYARVPLLRRLQKYPTSHSLPSGHSASAAAFAVGVGLENPMLGLVMALLAGFVGFSRVATGAHYPGDVAVGFGIGAAVAVSGSRLVPPVSDHHLPAAKPLAVDIEPRADGAGVVLVVNPAAGSGTGARVLREVRRALPKVEIVELRREDDVDEVLRSAAERADVLGVAGGDGTVACAAGVAASTGRPLAVFPAGTFNHFAKDIGCDHVGNTVRAIREGTASYVDLVYFNGVKAVVNTAGIGAYPNFVRSRERLEHRIGKPAAAAWALLNTLRHDEPVRIGYDDQVMQTSLFFLGNSIYAPSGFAPTQRNRMDTGLMDVRILEAGRPLGRLRIMTSVALGRLSRSKLYHELRVPEFGFHAVDGPVAVALDGEVAGHYERAEFRAGYRALQVYSRLPLR